MCFGLGLNPTPCVSGASYLPQQMWWFIIECCWKKKCTLRSVPFFALLNDIFSQIFSNFMLYIFSPTKPTSFSLEENSLTAVFWKEKQQICWKSLLLRLEHRFNLLESNRHSVVSGYKPGTAFCTCAVVRHLCQTCDGLRSHTWVVH